MSLQGAASSATCRRTGGMGCAETRSAYEALLRVNDVHSCSYPKYMYIYIYIYLYIYNVLMYVFVRVRNRCSVFVAHMLGSYLRKHRLSSAGVREHNRRHSRGPRMRSSAAEAEPPCKSLSTSYVNLVIQVSRRASAS
jgi:hypothetical protein